MAISTANCISEQTLQTNSSAAAATLAVVAVDVELRPQRCSFVEAAVAGDRDVLQPLIKQKEPREAAFKLCLLC